MASKLAAGLDLNAIDNCTIERWCRRSSRNRRDLSGGSQKAITLALQTGTNKDRTFCRERIQNRTELRDLGPIQVFSDLSCSETKTRPVYRPPALRAETAGEVRQTASKVQALIGSLLFAKQRPRCAPMTRHPARAIATLITSSIWRQWLEQRFGARRALIGCSSYRTRVADERSLKTNVNF